MTVVKLFTLYFPFRTDEQFLNSEVDFVSKQPNIQLEIIPFFAVGKPRKIPGNITVNTTLAKHLLQNSETKLFPVFPHFFKIVKGVFHHRVYSFSGLRDVVGFVHHGNLIAKWASRNIQPDDILYTYWFERVTYGLSLFRQKDSKSNLLISRAHGYDIYEERRKHRFIPFRKSVISSTDYIYPVSADGKTYLQRIAQCSAKIKESFLGVRDNGLQPSKSEEIIRAVSCSSIIPLKRLDLIFQLLTKYHERNANKKFIWDHFGSGKMDKTLQDKIIRFEKEHVNFSVNLHGHVSNEDLMDFYRDQHVDAFINLSDTEGIPVSIMEAMSFGIPAIGRDVGGVSEIVNNNNGALLSATFDLEESVQQLTTLIGDNARRKNARSTFEKKFSADANYQKFYEYLLK